MPMKTLTETFLSNDELFDLTGYRRPSNMVNALKGMPIRFQVAPDGYPRVHRSQFEPGETPKASSSRKKPNLAVLKKKNKV